MRASLKPKLLTTLRDYTAAQFVRDLTAGVVVGIVAIPLAIAFGIASGVTPAQGIITAIVAGFVVSLLGGSRVQIGGPTGAFIVVVYGVVQTYGVDGLTLATLLAGLMLVAMGVARLGSVIKYIPHTVVVGFTSGIAVIIATSQVRDLLGLDTAALPAEFFGKWEMIAAHIGSFSPHAFVIGLLTVFIVALWPRVSRRIPGSVIAIAASAAAVAWFRLPVETIESRFGGLGGAMPHFACPAWGSHSWVELIRPAFTIAFLGGIESLLSAVVSDGMIGGRHRSNMELVAQGVANVGSALMGGIPATGAIARTVTNVKNGGRTPVAGIVHAATVLVVTVFFARWAGMIPLACLAGILLVVAYHMSEWRSFRDLLRGSRGSIGVLLTTFFLTIFIDITIAVEIGMVLSLFIFMQRVARMTKIEVLDREVTDDEETAAMNRLPVPAGVEVFEISGPFFFGVVHEFDEAARIVSKKPRVRILRLRNVPFMDSTALNSLRSFHRKCMHNHIHLVVTGIHVQPLNDMMRSDLYDLIGEANVFNNMKDALRRAEELAGTA